MSSVVGEVSARDSSLVAYWMSERSSESQSSLPVDRRKSEWSSGSSGVSPSSARLIVDVPVVLAAFAVVIPCSCSRVSM